MIRRRKTKNVSPSRVITKTCILSFVFGVFFHRSTMLIIFHHLISLIRHLIFSTRVTRCRPYLELVFAVLPARLPWSPLCYPLQTLLACLPVSWWLSVRVPLLCLLAGPAGARAGPAPSLDLRDRQLHPVRDQHQLPLRHQVPRCGSGWWRASSRLWIKSKVSAPFAVTTPLKPCSQGKIFRLKLPRCSPSDKPRLSGWFLR